MTLTVVGSIAFDAVETPSGSRDRLLGGSAVHFSLASSQLAETRIVGPVGDDFGEEEYAVLQRRGVNTDDIERVEGGQTFFWRGHYEYDLNTAHTDDTQLNVFGDFEPKLSDESRAADTLFLANIQPDLQRDVRAQCTGAQLAALDSMNFWIESTRDSLLETIGVVDMVLMNDAELRMLTEEPNLVRADGKVPPVEQVHLHHGTWLSEPSYGSGPFFAAGEEKTIAPFPRGYGMPVKAADTWLLLA